ncbi:MAG TPA: hypothetical protein GXZ82_10305 [Firmicutes bacterium]|nr:hypothetical protein [Bacillota bacterium]
MRRSIDRGRGKWYLGVTLGFLLFCIGLFLTWLDADGTGIMRTLPNICVGLGAGIFGGSTGIIIRMYLLDKDPQAGKQAEIETNDERNMAIIRRAKAQAFDLMVIVGAASLIVFSLLQVDVYIILILVAAYLSRFGVLIFFINKYQKEM